MGWNFPTLHLRWFDIAFILVFSLGGGLLIKLGSDDLAWWSRLFSDPSNGKPAHSRRTCLVVKWFCVVCLLLVAAAMVQLYCDTRSA